MAGVALAAGTAAQLVVDAAALVALGAEHVKAAGSERFFLQARDLRTDLSGARILVARRQSSMSAISWRMRMSGLPPS